MDTDVKNISKDEILATVAELDIDHKLGVPYGMGFDSLRKSHILAMRQSGYSIQHISDKLGLSITVVCEVVWSHKFDQQGEIV